MPNPLKPRVNKILPLLSCLSQLFTAIREDLHACVHTGLGPRSCQLSSLRFPVLRQGAGALSPFLPRAGVCALVVYNVCVSLGYLMGLELAKGVWLATSSRNLASPGLRFQAHITTSCVLVVALNVGARDGSKSSSHAWPIDTSPTEPSP